jgi:hypothetical protein
VVVLVIAGISYITCLTGGQAICGNNAANLCGDRGADEYNMICGAGYDVEGHFHLGFECSFRCNE